MRVKVIACIGSDAPSLLGHFLEHYRALGVDEFVILLHSRGRLDFRTRRIRHVLAGHGLAPRDIWRGTFNTQEKDRRLDALWTRWITPTDWVLPCDEDEFRLFPGGMKVFFEHCDRIGCDCINGKLLDRLAPDGRLPAITDTPSIWEQFPLGSRLSADLLGACIDKVVACRGHLRPGTGHHFITTDRPAQGAHPACLNVHHFKWDRTAPRRLRHRVRVFKKLGYHWVVQSEKAISFLREHGGRFPPEHPQVNAVRIDRSNVIAGSEADPAAGQPV